MRAAVVQEPGLVEVVDVADPSPGPDDVVVEVAACGVCGTDVHILHGEFAPRLPVTPGHELAGTVVAVGRDVTGLRVGDVVAADPNLYCGRCHYCRRGRGNLCERFAALGVTHPGGAAQYVAVPAGNCVRLPEHVRAEDAVLIEPLSCAVHAVDVLRGRVGDHCLVYGAGTMGLMVLRLALATGAASVDVVDTDPGKLVAAQALGCRQAVTDADELDMPRGWEVVVDCTGAPSAIEDGLSRVGRGGTFLQVGVTSPGTRVGWEPYRVFREEITITGSMGVLHSYERAAELFFGGLVDPALLVSDRFRLDDYRAALDLVAAGTARKVLVTPHH